MIYRDLELTTSSVPNLSLLLKGLFLSGGRIYSMGKMSNGFPDNKFHRWSTFYKLEFINQESLNEFHTIAFQTTDPEIITGA